MDRECEPLPMTRCSWCVGDPLMQAYHDEEWGYPVREDGPLFEKLALEGFQAGLSWRTILHKREHFRRAFAHFDLDALARFTDCDVQVLLQDPGIVRHRGKIEAVIHNANCARSLIAQAGPGALAQLLWQHAPTPQSSAAQAQVCAADLSSALKKRGWKFVGPTTVYAFMQACGMVNDHALHCIIRPKVQVAFEASLRL